MGKKVEREGKVKRTGVQKEMNVYAINNTVENEKSENEKGEGVVG